MNETFQLSALDHHFAEFINGMDTKPGRALWLAAAMASAAAAQGHACFNLTDCREKTVLPFRPGERLVLPPSDQWRLDLEQCSTVGRPGDYRPLVLDRAGRLYLHRVWNYERLVAEAILARATEAPLDIPLLSSGLDRYFPETAENPDWQRVAAVAALSGCFTVVSGGPGTGKTATVARILALLIEQAEGTRLRISLTAPTGKAAMRLRQSILHSIRHLDLPKTVLEQLPDEVQTIHRLLGANPGSSTFRYNSENLLPYDLLIVDEVSMVDLPLMAKLLQALPSSTRLILLGDRDQLASVEAGAVLADICNHGLQVPFSPPFQRLLAHTCGMPVADAGAGAPSATTPLADRVIQLKTSYRFGNASGIGALSRMINAGEADQALALLQSGRYEDLQWRPLPDSASFDACFMAAAGSGFGDYAAAPRPEVALEALNRFRILTPYREGPGGVLHLNRMAEHALGLHRAADQSCSLLPILVTGNNYELGLFNGDTAVLMDSGTGDANLRAYFPDSEDRLRSFSPVRLPPWESAFALTVHKSQGSEFEQVLLILPDRISGTLSRELLYTAVTRARNRIEIWASEDVFRHAVERKTIRNSGLRDRLWGNVHEAHQQVIPEVDDTL